MARVALYYPWIYLCGGGERLIHELITASRHDWTIFTNHFDADTTLPEMAELDVVELERVSTRRSLRPLLHAAYTIRTQRLPLEEFDALVVVCEGFGDLAAFGSRGTPTACVCFTPLKIIHDDAAAARLRAHQPPLTRAAYAVLSPLYQVVERAAWRRYHSVVAISEEVKRRIVTAGLAPAGLIEVAYPGVPLPPDQPVTYEPYFLITGRIMWEKNIELGIDAFRHFTQQPGREDYRLVVAGQVDGKSRPYLRLLQERAEGLRVDFVDTPSTEEMQDLYRRSLGQLFTAPNEEFGIVVLESMSYRKPVISVRRGGPAEIVRDGVDGWLVPPEAAEMAAAMERIAASDGTAARMGSDARQRAMEFTWERFAAAVDRHVDEAVAEGVGNRTGKAIR